MAISLLLVVAALVAAVPEAGSVDQLGVDEGAPELIKSPKRSVAPRTEHPPSGQAADYVIIAANSAELKTGAQVLTGSVAVNNVSAGPTLNAGEASFPNPELTLARNATVAADVAADSVYQNRGSSVAGSIFNNELLQKGGATGTSVSPLTLPVVALPPFFEANVRPDAENVTVAAGTVVALPAGEYGRLTIAEGGKALLSGGIYRFRSVAPVSTQGGACPFPCRSIEAQAGADVRVDGRFDLGKNSYFGPANGSLISAANLIVYVAGSNAVPSAPNSLPPAATVGQSSTFHGTLFGPNGTLLVDRNSIFSGAAYGRDVRFDRDTEIHLAAFEGAGNQPPTADAQTVYTEGASSIVITLTGSDPEFEDLGFDIVAGPTAGTLGPITPIVPDPIEDPGNPGTFVQPPVVSAEVTYTPTDPGAEATDAFTFQVADPYGATDQAVVDINPPDDPGDPSPIEDVIANDLLRETLSGVPITIDLAAGATGPDGVALSFAVETLPGGSLVDSNEDPITTAPYALPGSVVTYTPPAEGSADSFDYSVAGTVDGVPQTAVATVSIGIAGPLDLAPDVEVDTNRNTPVKVTLPANPGGSGQPAATTSRVSRANGTVLGASIAGNVSDGNGDGLGDGRDNLPGPAPVLVAAGVDVNLGATPAGNVTDPAGDATDDTRVDPDPDLVSGSAGSDGTNMNFTVAFAAGTFNSSVSRASFVLDTDENPATGFPGVDAANNDSALMGVEYLVNIGANLGANADVFRFVSLPNNFDLVGTFPATVNANGYSVAIPLATLGGDDGRMTFKVETQHYLGPGFTGILDYMPDLGLAPGQAKTGVRGVARIEIEWDISNLTDGDAIESATVTLTTEKGTVDSLDTFFYAGSADQDGLLTVSDYQTPASQLAGVVMPVPAGSQPGDEGTFSFDVTNALKAAVTEGFDFFTVQGRVDEALAGQGFQRGLQVRSTATGNLTSGKEPKLDVLLEEPSLGLTWTVLSLPSSGTLKSLGGAPISVGQTFTVAPTLVYTPNFNFTGPDSFGYSVQQGAVVDSGVIGFEVLAGDDCDEVGRPPGCAPFPGDDFAVASPAGGRAVYRVGDHDTGPSASGGRRVLFR